MHEERRFGHLMIPSRGGCGLELRHGQLQAVLQGNDHDGHPRLATPIRRSPGTQYRKRLLVLDLRPSEQHCHGLACRRTGAGPLEVPGGTALLLRLQVLGYSRCHLDLPGTIVVLSGCRNLSIPDPSPRPPVAQTRAPSDFQRADRPSAHARSDRALRKSSPRRSPDSVLVQRERVGRAHPYARSPTRAGAPCRVRELSFSGPLRRSAPPASHVRKAIP